MIEYSMEELIPVVAELSEKYTSKESSSITYEKAQQLMEAVIYCIRELDESDSVIGEKQYLKQPNKSAKEDYQEGYRLVVNRVFKVKERYEKILEGFQSYGNLCLKETVLKGIPGFLRHYDPKFAPQSHLLTFDYPTLIDPLKQCGVDAVDTYLCSIEIEQEFLNSFSYEFVVSTLEANHNDYEGLFLNLSSIVMRNMIGTMIAKKPRNQRRFDQKDYETIHLWIKRREERLEESLNEILGFIIHKGYKDNQKMLEYFINDMSDFSTELRNACKYNCLHTVIS